MSLALACHGSGAVVNGGRTIAFGPDLPQLLGRAFFLVVSCLLLALRDRGKQRPRFACPRAFPKWGPMSAALPQSKRSPDRLDGDHGGADRSFAVLSV
jgi:hypothetical protein